MDNNDDCVNQLETIVNVLVSMFYQKTQLTPITTQIEFVDDIYQRRLELATSQKDKTNVIKQKKLSLILTEQ